MRIRPLIAALVAIGVLGTASCASQSVELRGVGRAGGASPGPAAGAGQSGGGAQTGPTGQPVVVPKSLTFDAKTLAGQQFHAASLAGRPVVLWFWAPWCATCAGQAWSIGDMVKRYGDRVAIVGVAGLGKTGAMKEFVDEFDLQNSTQLNDQAGVVWRRFKITEQSTYVILDRSGKIVHQGWMDSVDFEAKVAALAA